MTTYTEEQLIDGAIARDYTDGTSFIYRKLNTRNVFVESLKIKDVSNGYSDFEDFIIQKHNKNVFVKLTVNSDETVAVLSKLGFEQSSREVNNTQVDYQLIRN